MTKFLIAQLGKAWRILYYKNWKIFCTSPLYTSTIFCRKSLLTIVMNEELKHFYGFPVMLALLSIIFNILYWVLVQYSHIFYFLPDRSFIWPIFRRPEWICLFNFVVDTLLKSWVNLLKLFPVLNVPNF